MNTVETEKKAKKSTKQSSTKKSIKSEKIETPIIETVEPPIVEKIDEEQESINEKEELTDNVEDLSITNDEVILHNQTIEKLLVANKISFKNRDINKEFISSYVKSLTKINKLVSAALNDAVEFFGKEFSSSLKNKDSKGKKIKKKLVKENCPINKLKPTYNEVLEFMKLPEGTNTSSAEVIIAINAFISKEKNIENSDIYVIEENNIRNKRKFYLIKELKVLFEFIKKIMVERNELNEDNNFNNVLSYSDIMKYLKFCFPLPQKST